MRRCALGEILYIQKGKKPLSQSNEAIDGYLPYVDIKAFEKGVIDNYASTEKSLLCEAGDLLIVCDGSRSGLTGRAIKGVVGSTLAKIYADGLTTEYLRYFIQSKYTLLNTQKKGTGTPHLNAEILKSSKITVPSIPEQDRIVSRIEELFSELDKAVVTLKTTKQQLSVYRQTVLKDVFSDFVESEPIKKIATMVTSGSRGWAKYYSDSGALFVRISNLTRNGIEIKFDDIQYVALPEKAEGKRSKLKENDVLISITADLGSIGLVLNGIGEAYVNQHIALVRFKNPLQGKFMAWFLRSDYGQKNLLKNKRGLGKLGLGLDDIKNTNVPIVSDLTAKKIVLEIESRLSICDSIEKTVDSTLSKAEAVRQSILKKAFEGGL